VTPLRVTIVGAGIGGLTAALALAGQGHDVLVIERRTGFSERGAGIQLSPNASRVLVGLGLGGSLKRIGAEPQGVVMRAMASGRDLARVPLGPAMRQRYGAPYLVVARSDLHTALLDAVRGRGNIRLMVGRTLVSARDGRSDAAITIETGAGGRETLACDLLVGADGLHSRMRPALGDARPLVYSGFAASRAVVPLAALPAGFALNETGLWLGRGRHVVHYGIDGGRHLNIVAIEPRRESALGWSADEPGAALLARFRDAAPALHALLAIPESWAAWSLFDLPAKRMAGSRIALLGDAAHPVLPFLAQGGALAIEDAAELAGQLAAATDIPAALAAYAAARLRRVRRVQSEARRNGRLYHMAGPAAFARNLVLGRTKPARLADRYAWIYAWQPSRSV
jgi:salicylate hydroxylase